MEASGPVVWLARAGAEERDTPSLSDAGRLTQRSAVRFEDTVQEGPTLEAVAGCAASSHPDPSST